MKTRSKLAGISASIVALLTLAVSAEPSWWLASGAKDSSLNPSDFAAINQGQLKNLAKAARDHLEANLAGGAGGEIDSMLASWSIATPSTSDFSAVNLGQLKAVAKPFYDRLIATGNASTYPWTSSSSGSDYALANIGQVKMAFSFVAKFGKEEGDVYSGPDAESGYALQNDGLDTDMDGIPDWIELSAGTDHLNSSSIPTVMKLVMIKSRLSVFMTNDLADTLTGI